MLPVQVISVVRDALAHARARRVRKGGHRIPEEVVIRRYAAGLRNMRHLYLPFVDIGYIYDNSDRRAHLIAERQPYASLIVHDPGRWKLIEDSTR